MDIPLEIQTENLVKAFGRHYALRGVNLELGQGEGLVMIGPNGAGKTTLLRCLAGLDRPPDGKVLLRGPDRTALSHPGPGAVQRLAAGPFSGQGASAPADGAAPRRTVHGTRYAGD